MLARESHSILEHQIKTCPLQKKDFKVQWNLTYCKILTKKLIVHCGGALSTRKIELNGLAEIQHVHSRLSHPPNPLFVFLYVKFFFNICMWIGRKNKLYEFFSFVRFLPQLIFRPPLDHYDVIIHLHNRLLSRRTQALDRVKHSTEETSSSSPSVLLPVVNFDPSRLYLEELKVRTDFSCNIKRTLTIDKPNIARLKFKMFMKFIFSRRRFQMLRCSFTMFMVGTLLELCGSLTALNQLRLRCSPLLFCRTLSPH